MLNYGVRMILVLAIMTLLAGCLNSLSFASDWPTYMHDWTRVGYTNDRLDAPLVEQWVVASASPPRLAWPGPGGKTIEGLKLEHRVRFDDVFHVAVVGNRVYFGSSVDNTLYCVDADTGETTWSYVTGAPIRLAPTVAEGRVYVGSDDGFVYCLDAWAGQLVWKLRAGPRDERMLARGRLTSRWPVRTGILVDAGVAYFGAGVFPHEMVYLYAVDADTGAVLWKNDAISERDADRDDLTPQGYLLATDDILFVPSGRTLPAAVSRKTGELLHKQRGGGKQVGGTEALLAGEEIFSVGEHNILALNQKAGDIDDRLVGRRMTVHGNMSYIADGEQIVAIDRVQFAKVKAQRLKLEREAFDQQVELRRHVAPYDLKRVEEAQAKLSEAQRQLTKLAGRGNEGTPEYQEARTASVKWAKALSEASAAYETSRNDYQDKQAQLQETKQRIDDLVHGGIKWRRDISHESSMILADNRLVVGGIGEVVMLDAESGQTLWTRTVEGEVRGLATANGRLYASTTAGKIYAFADASSSPSGRPRAGSRPVAEPFAQDELTSMYAEAAKQIVRRSGVTRGFCLVYGSDRGRLAYELAKRTGLVIYCIDSDAAKVAEARKTLAATGLYGNRITFDHVDLSIDPLPNYFANLIVSDRLLSSGQMPGEPREVARHLKPEGGVMCLGVPDGASADVKSHAADSVRPWIARTGLLDQNTTVQIQDGWTLAKRGPLPGSAAWTHEYGNPGNTSSVDDVRIKGGLSVLWYGDPGPSEMLNRHQGAVGPVSAHGRLFVQGDESVKAYDAFNGLFLWEFKNPGALRTGVFMNYEPGNLVAGDDNLFVVIEDQCLELDAATGQVRRTYVIPDPGDSESRQWGYVAYKDGRLYGSSTVRKLIADEARRRGRPTETDNTDKVFAFDTKTGELLWLYLGQSISHTTMAIDDQHVYFIDSTLTPEQRDRLVRQDKEELKKLTGKDRDLAEDRIKRIDARLAVALDAVTGQERWSRPVDVTDCTGVGIGAGRLTLMAADGYVVLCGANANGHYWQQFLAGDFQRRRLVVLSASDGEKVWAKDANYRHRPIVIGRRIIAEPWSYFLDSGEQETRTHPLTGDKTAWKFIRPGHHCGAISATPSMMFFRSGYTAYYDLESDSGTRHFAGHRLGCWINTIPANGLVMIPEASAGCACLFSLTSTIVFEPRKDRQPWAVYSAEGVSTPVQHMALNLGGPGDRRDARGKLWLSYPRPSSRDGLDLPLDLQPMSPFGITGTSVRHNSDAYQVQDTDTPWIYASGLVGMTQCRLPLIGDGQPAANYSVRLLFAAPDGDKPEQRVFDVKLQGQTVESKVDVAARAGGTRRALIIEHQNIPVTRDLLVELVPLSRNLNGSSLPMICGIEVVRADSREIVESVAVH